MTNVCPALDRGVMLFPQGRRKTQPCLALCHHIATSLYLQLTNQKPAREQTQVGKWKVGFPSVNLTAQTNNSLLTWKENQQITLI